LAVEKLIHGASHLLQAQIAIDIPLKDGLGFRRWLKPLHAHAGKRVRNFSFALYPGLIEGLLAIIGQRIFLDRRC
jgi:hypothetical protein